MNRLHNRTLLTVAAALALGLPAAAQPAFQVADLNTVSPGSTYVWPYGMEVEEAGGKVFFAGSGPNALAVLGVWAYFVADDGTVFSDVGPGHFARDWIEQLAAEGITGGCGGGRYCPDAAVTRAQMAVFLTSAFRLLP